MRRVNGLAFLTRTIAASSAGAGSTCQHKMVRAATVSTCSSLNSTGRIADRFGISSTSVTRGVAKALFFSAVASHLVQEAHAKEPPPPEKFLPKDVVLYQYEACPFCNKVKAFLDYYNIPYKIVEVNPINKKEIKWSDYQKVPILKVDGEKMVDSSDIIDKLFQRIHPDKSIPKDDEESKWRGWVDNHLVHVLAPNIYRSPSEALESFDYITTHGFSLVEMKKTYLGWVHDFVHGPSQLQHATKDKDGMSLLVWSKNKAIDPA